MTENTQPVTLLTLALAAAKPQWYSGESVWLVGQGKTGKAYLKNTGGWIHLYVIGYDTPLPIFVLDPALNAWVETRQARAEYSSWAARAKQAIQQ
jgi:hypothetical protein